jgi:hypothetical protein
MPHCNTITYPDDTEFEWNPTCCSDPFPNFFAQLPKVYVAGDNRIECICNPDERQIHFPVGHPKGPEQGSVRRPGIARFDLITAHGLFLSFFLYQMIQLENK